VGDFPPDHELIEFVQKGQAWAFENLYERFEGSIRSHLLYMVRDEGEAEDLLQEVFLRLWTRAGQWTGQGSVRGWLFRIATNLALNHLRTRRRRPEGPLELPENLEEDDPLDPPAWLVDDTSLGPDAVLDRNERSEHIRVMILDLPEDKKEVFRLVHQLEMSLRDAADELNIPVGTAKSRLHYARERLSQQWREWQADKE
jgi:RNA polymerase sigma-70 factor, ECF subfamily